VGTILIHHITAATTVRTTSAFPDEAVLHCRAGTAALKGKQHDAAHASFRRALQLNPLLWEAFEGLCTLGACPSTRRRLAHI
jgi:anaphase-promoting complex subunit 3